MNIFIIVKITKSARFRRQFRRHDDEDVEEPDDVDEENISNHHQRQQSGRNRLGPATTNILTKLASTDRNFRSSGTNFSRNQNNSAVVHVCVSGRGFQPRRTFIRKQKEEHTLGLILIGMSSLFIFCQSFKIIPDLYELVVCNQVGNLGHNCAISKVPAMNVITRISHLLVCVNSSTNFLIYYLNGEKFRRAWLETYGGWCFCCCRQSSMRQRASNTIAMQSVRMEVQADSAAGNVESSGPIAEETNGQFLHPMSALTNHKKTKTKRNEESSSLL